jgi:ABC-type nitrate/sulfonate/bicarbonate transport system substrate-binding protein
MQTQVAGRRLLAVTGITALVAAACGAAATPAPTGAFNIHLQLTPSHVSVAVAADRGYLKGIKLDYEMVGYGESSQLFHAGTDPIGNESPWEAAAYQEQGKDIRYFSSLEASNLIAPVIIRTSDKDKYKTLADLKGHKFGIPGFGTGTWAAFQTVAKSLVNLNATKDFQIIEGNPGDLEGLLQTNAIDAFITFTAPTAHAVANPAYTALFSMTDEWKKAEGVYLPVSGWIAEAKWLDEHLEIAKNFLAGVQKGLEDVKKDPAIDDAGTKYEKWAQGEGRMTSPETQQLTDRWIKDGYFWLDGSTYTKAYAESVYKFVKQGEGVLVKTAPPIDKVFYEKTYWGL